MEAVILSRQSLILKQRVPMVERKYFGVRVVPLSSLVIIIYE